MPGDGPRNSNEIDASTWRGNKTLKTYDQQYYICRTQTNLKGYGPEILMAKTLASEILADRVINLPDDMRKVIRGTFHVGSVGKIRPEKVRELRSYEVDHPRWAEFQKLVDDAEEERVARVYYHYQIKNDNGALEELQLNLSSATVKRSGADE